MKVLLVTVPPLDPTKPPAIFSILGACCDAVQCEYEIFDLNLYLYKTLSDDKTTELITDLQTGSFRSAETQQNYDAICKHLISVIADHKPDVVAISVFTIMSHLSTEHLLKKINSTPRNFKILIGGLGISSLISDSSSTFADYCISNNLVDYYINGDGELAFMEFLKGNLNYPGINNKNNVQINDLDNLPMPSYNKVNPNDYFYAFKPEVLVTGSRGCVRDCTFCNVGDYWSKYVYKSGKRMAHELLEIWKATGVQNFDFTDSLINGSISSFREFNSEIIALKEIYSDFKPSYRGQFICRPVGQLKDSDYEQMSRAGVEAISVGIESFSDSVRTHMRKKFSNDDIDYHFGLCAKYNIKNNLLLLSGYPTETIDDHTINLEYLKKYQVYALSRIIYSINIEVGGLLLTPNGGSPLNNYEHELQIQYTNHGSYGHTWISLKNPSLTRKERLRRSAEIIYTAYSLGYKVVNIHQKIDAVEKHLTK